MVMPYKIRIQNVKKAICQHETHSNKKVISIGALSLLNIQDNKLRGFDAKPSIYKLEKLYEPQHK